MPAPLIWIEAKAQSGGTASATNIVSVSPKPRSSIQSSNFASAYADGRHPPPTSSLLLPCWCTHPPPPCQRSPRLCQGSSVWWALGFRVNIWAPAHRRRWHVTRTGRARATVDGRGAGRFVEPLVKQRSHEFSFWKIHLASSKYRRNSISTFNYKIG